MKKQPSIKSLKLEVKQLRERIEEQERRRNEKFNKYRFLCELEQTIREAIESGEIEDEDGVQNRINSDIDNECIYYSTCFEIAQELNATDFKEFGMDINNISQLAYCALDEYVREELDTNTFFELIEAKHAQAE